MSWNNRSYSLQSMISGAIVIAIVLVASVIMAISYSYNRELLKDATLDRVQLAADELNGLLQKTFLPAQRTLELMRWDQLMYSETTEQRLRSLPQLADMLRNDPVTDAIYVGFDDGDFILVRPVRTERVRALLKAPVGTRFVGEFIEQDGLEEWRFYNAQLQQIGRRIDPAVTYDPRVRPWFDIALKSDQMQVSDPYVFFTTREAGVTLSRGSPTGAVIGIDFALNDLSKYLANQSLGEGVELALITRDLRVLASPDVEPVATDQADLQLTRLSDHPEFSINQFTDIPLETLVEGHSAGTDYLGYRMSIFEQWNIQIDLLVSIPAKNLIGDVISLQRNTLLIALVLTGLMLSGGWWIGRRIARPLQQLGDQVARLAAFDFSQPPEVDSNVKEVNELCNQLESMTATITRFRQIAHTLAAEQNTDRMLHKVNHLLAETVGGRRSLIYLYDIDQRTLTRTSHYGQSHGTPEVITNVPNDSKAQVERLKLELPKSEHQYLVIPLFDRDHETLGLVEIELYDSSLRQNSDYRAFVHELSGLAATAIATRSLIAEQKQLTEAIIKLLADAIDAKSPYTHGHCARVPELAKLLTDAVEHSNAPEFKSFKLTEQERYTLSVAAWLHDCGKITSPEYVVDKAVKLETLHNRIHEIRTRFEVLWRDAEIHYLSGLVNKGNEMALRNELKATQARLRQEFNLVARANIGDVPLKAEEIEQLHQIAKQTWTRHFDRRIGLSYAEADRLQKAGTKFDTLPATERLLEDREDHLIEWGKKLPPVQKDDPNNRWGFDMQLPTHALNLGELYNLSVQRGTLTAEERFKINEHIVQSIVMLESLPLPRNMRDVPAIAGNHHERMDGRGYPRKLTASELSIPARIMAIADVFEALTASDRPYKPAKKLSQSLVILANMAAEGHIDPHIFKLFVEEEVYLSYAKSFLDHEQRDDVDKRAIIKIFEARLTEAVAS